MRHIFLITLIITFGLALFAEVSFIEVDNNFPEITLGASAWGDINNNGNLDVILTGYTYGTGAMMQPITSLFLNNGDETFTELDTDFIDLSVSKPIWGDLNNNGYLDLILFGYTGGTGGDTIFRLYMNNGDETFTEILTDIPGFYRGDLALGDFNNNGYLDILLTGDNGNSENAEMTRIYKNNGDMTFTDINADLQPMNHSACAWIDLNNNGLLDIILTGRIGSFDFTSRVYINNGDESFTLIDHNLAGLRYSSISIGDYNNDGYTDFIMTGGESPGAGMPDTRRSLLYKNNGNLTFTELDLGLTGVSQGRAEFADLNNNGLLDIILTGEMQVGWTSKIYINQDDDEFIESDFELIEVRRSFIAVADFNNNGSADFLLTGWNQSGVYISKLYKNIHEEENEAPIPPENLTTVIYEDHVVLSWDNGSDDNTPPEGLTYNLRIGTSEGGIDVMSPMADLSNGFRKVPKVGNMQQNNSITIYDLPVGSYYWSVQTIDHCFKGSTFSADYSFTIEEGVEIPDVPELIQPQNGIENLANRGQMIWSQTGENVSYTIQLSSDADFDNLIIDNNTANTSFLTGLLEFGQEYFWRVKSNLAGESSEWSEPWSFQTIELLEGIENLSAEVENFDSIALNWVFYLRRDNLSSQIVLSRDEVVPQSFFVYRNSALIDEVEDINDTAYLDYYLDSGFYTYNVSVMYGEDIYGFNYESFLSDDVEVEIFLYPPENFNAVAGNSEIFLSWEFVTDFRDMVGFNVYRNGNLLNTEPILEIGYHDTGLDNGVLYEYHVRTVYNGGLSEPSDTIIISPIEPLLYQPFLYNPSIENGLVSLSWEGFNSEFDYWRHWDNGMNIGGIGTNSEADFSVSIRFDYEDLQTIEAPFLTYVSFFPREVNCIYSVRVWINGSVDADYNVIEGDLIVDQVVPNEDLINHQWNIVLLEEPVLLDDIDEIWVGYRIQTQEGYPAGRDTGPAVQGKGDLVKLEGWEVLSHSYSHLDYNWNIQAYFTENIPDNIMVNKLNKISDNSSNNNTENRILTTDNYTDYYDFERLFISPEWTAYQLFRNDIMIAEINDLSETVFYDDLSNEEFGSYLYKMRNVYEEGMSIFSKTYEIEFLNSGDEVFGTETKLIGNFPNPFNPNTNINFKIAESSHVNLTIYNLAGQRVVVLLDEILQAGLHSFQWDGSSNIGTKLGSGIYFYRLQASEYSFTGKMLMLK